MKVKVNDHNHDKHITTPEFITMAAEVFNARLAGTNVITKTDFTIFAVYYKILVEGLLQINLKICLLKMS